MHRIQLLHSLGLLISVKNEDRRFIEPIKN